MKTINNMIFLVFVTVFEFFYVSSTNVSKKHSEDLWENVVMCPNYQNNNIVTGFQVTFDHYDPNNQEDKTILNGIWLGCSLPFQSEQNQETNSVWVNGAGGSLNGSSQFGIPDQKLYCSGYTVGFRLRIQTAKNIHYSVNEDNTVGVVNVKMICDDGEELEGHDEKWDYYPVAEYTLEPLKCEERMGVCGVQTQMMEINLIGGAPTTQLNNLRIQCCPVPHSKGFAASAQEMENATTTKRPYESPFTPSPRRLNVTLFDNTTVKNETILIRSGECNPIPESWRQSLMTLVQKSVCIRLWESDECKGYTRCYCDSNHLLLDDSFKMSRNASWQGNVNALTPCFLEDGKEYTRARALIFSEKNYQGDLQGSVILEPQECLTFYEGDRWHNTISSIIVTDGCLEYFSGEECTEERERLDGSSPRNELSERFEKSIKSVRNCGSVGTTF